MVAAGVDPLAVEAVELIIIMHALILSEVEGRVGNREAVLVVLQTDFPAAVEHRFDGASESWAHQLIVYLQVAESEGDVPQRVDVGWVEHRDTVSTSEHQTAVGQLARGTVHELVACQTVGLVERGDAPRLDIQTVQALHRTDPQIALTALLDAGHIGTGETRYARHLVGLGVVAQQTVAHSAYPHISVLVLMHVGGDVYATTDALLHVRDFQLCQLARLGIHPRDVLVEGRDEHLSVVQLQERRNEGVVHVECLLGLRLTAARMEAEEVGRARCHPHRPVVRLLEVHRHRHGPLSEYVQSRAVILALHHDVGGREPQPSVTVAEYMGHGILRLAGGQSLDDHLLCLLRMAVIHEYALRHGRYPQVLLLVNLYGHHR